MNYETIAESNESTVVAQFHSDNESKSSYESEADLERAFITLLQKQALKQAIRRFLMAVLWLGVLTNP
ncbi:hypothetical protein KVE51_03820 [Helicobacter pylori]|nr:hypothetical protein KVE51_03820 [Helicobacter pylori]